MTAKSINISAYAGQAVRLTMIQAAVNNFFFDILMDNVRIDGGTKLEQTAGIASGKMFPVGTTTNTYVATDLAGNSSTCSFNVTGPFKARDCAKPVRHLFIYYGIQIKSSVLVLLG